MDKKKIMKIAGVAATVVGGALLYVSGSGEEMAMELVGAIFLVAGIIGNFFNWMRKAGEVVY